MIEGVFWADENGEIRRVSQSRFAIDFRKPRNQALRAFVFKRDDFTCRGCGLRFQIDSNYRGGYSPSVDTGNITLRFLHVDHVVPRVDGGSHHPNNLQALCSRCNSKKGAR